MIDTRKKFSVHIMHTKPAETDLILTGARAHHDAQGALARHDLHGLPARRALAS